MDDGQKHPKFTIRNTLPRFAIFASCYILHISLRGFVVALRFDILVVGSGLAGQSAALRLAQTHSVGLISKRTLQDSASSWAQGGIAAVLPDGDPDFAVPGPLVMLMMRGADGRGGVEAKRVWILDADEARAMHDALTRALSALSPGKRA